MIRLLIKITRNIIKFKSFLNFLNININNPNEMPSQNYLDWRLGGRENFFVATLEKGGI